jgi:hypothetical protein
MKSIRVDQVTNNFLVVMDDVQQILMHVKANDISS